MDYGAGKECVLAIVFDGLACKLVGGCGLPSVRN